MPPKAPLKAKGAPSSSPDSKKSATNSRTSAKSVSPSRPDRPDKSDKVEKVVVPVEIKKTRGQILAEARAAQLEASLKAQESSDPTCNESHKHRSSHDIGEEFIDNVSKGVIKVAAFSYLEAFLLISCLYIIIWCGRDSFNFLLLSQ